MGNDSSGVGEGKGKGSDEGSDVGHCGDVNCGGGGDNNSDSDGGDGDSNSAVAAMTVVSCKHGTQEVCTVNKVREYHCICEMVESVHAAV